MGSVRIERSLSAPVVARWLLAGLLIEAGSVAVRFSRPTSGPHGVGVST
jgi:hypothetical protein